MVPTMFWLVEMQVGTWFLNVVIYCMNKNKLSVEARHLTNK